MHDVSSTLNGLWQTVSTPGYQRAHCNTEIYPTGSERQAITAPLLLTTNTKRTEFHFKLHQDAKSFCSSCGCGLKGAKVSWILQVKKNSVTALKALPVIL